MSKRPSIKQLEYFVTVARASSFHGAADQLGVTQPALTIQIAALEKLLGVQLFDRSRAGTLLSPAGREMLPLAREILDQYQQLADLGEQSGHEMAGNYRMGVSPTIGPYLLPRVLPVLHQRFPHLKLHIQEDVPRKLEQGLDSGTFDLILTVLPVNAGSNRVRPLFTETIKAVFRTDHVLAKKQKIRGRDLHLQGVLDIDETHHLHRQLVTLCDKYGAKLLYQQEANTLSAMRLMAMLGMGIAFLPELFLQAELNQSEDLKAVSLEDEELTRTHIAMWRKNASSRHLFQKLSYEIKAIALEQFGSVLVDASTDEALPETW
ncbi:MAG TPA: hydrogen peroxide-inducible genes activator [Candidatus Acidoferrum sp.]|nr:hydrogen peroxide-inducible genes activator [Candidatus Acidoferrum sp.]